MADKFKMVELGVRTEMPPETLQELEWELTRDVAQFILTPDRIKTFRKLQPGELLYEHRWAIDVAKLIIQSLQRHRWHIVRLPHGMDGPRNSSMPD
ncbi:hypothetical protein ACFPL7_22355 [Dongia soli]|uniref:Uncharacterized protein n=1 Tax=Dongia soli TaxID=600628 RepID=A0ABU5E8F8_9PROT|nr:hypothetical protein [Dongia soli]MDY0882334.1 hypothetical protein [Dongia soli]